MQTIDTSLHPEGVADIKTTPIVVACMRGGKTTRLATFALFELVAGIARAGCRQIVQAILKVGP